MTNTGFTLLNVSKNNLRHCMSNTMTRRRRRPHHEYDPATVSIHPLTFPFPFTVQLLHPLALYVPPLCSTHPLALSLPFIVQLLHPFALSLPSSVQLTHSHSSFHSSSHPLALSLPFTVQLTHSHSSFHSSIHTLALCVPFSVQLIHLHSVFRLSVQLTNSHSLFLLRFNSPTRTLFTSFHTSTHLLALSSLPFTVQRTHSHSLHSTHRLA